MTQMDYASLVSHYVTSCEDLYKSSSHFHQAVDHLMQAHNIENVPKTREDLFLLDLKNQTIGLLAGMQSFHEPYLVSLYRALTPKKQYTTDISASNALEQDVNSFIWNSRGHEEFLTEPVSSMMKIILDSRDTSLNAREHIANSVQALLTKLKNDIITSPTLTAEERAPAARLLSPKLISLKREMNSRGLMAYRDEEILTETLNQMISSSRPNTSRNNSIPQRSVPSAGLPAPIEEAPKPVETETLKELLADLDRKIGLDDIKKIVHDTVNTTIIQQERARRGKKTTPLSLHMAFTGNPGTGKTTIARLVAKIFKELKILDKGHFTEARRSDLTGSHIGETEKKTRELLDKAVGGVLFIDEIQSMIPSGERDFAREANTEIVAAMENNRDNLIVIIAGYPDKVEEYIKCDAGFNDRFAIRGHFADYDAPALKQIFHQMLKEEDFSLHPKAEKHLDSLIDWEKNRAKEGFGNARFMRSLRDFAIRAQHNRLRHSTDDLSSLSDKDFDHIKVADLTAAIDEIQKQRGDHKTGFSSRQDFIGFVDPKNPPRAVKKHRQSPKQRHAPRLKL